MNILFDVLVFDLLIIEIFAFDILFSMFDVFEIRDVFWSLFSINKSFKFYVFDILKLDQARDRSVLESWKIKYRKSLLAKLLEMLPSLLSLHRSLPFGFKILRLTTRDVYRLCNDLSLLLTIKIFENINGNIFL